MGKSKRKDDSARAVLAELRTSGKLLSNQAILINSIPMLEAQASSEIENIFTTTDQLFCFANDAAKQADPAAKETLSCRTALHRALSKYNRLLKFLHFNVFKCAFDDSEERGGNAGSSQQRI